MVNILLVEDDKSFGYVLSEYMSYKHYKVDWVETTTQAIRKITNNTYDLIILDINLRDGSGYDVANHILDKKSKTPFIFLTARDLKIDQLKGYKLGAEEYITKPIDEEILIAKIEAIIARNKGKQPKSEEIIVWKSIRLDSSKRELTVNNNLFKLTEKESLLIKVLLSNAEKLVYRNDILQDIWESQDEFSRNSMDVYLSRLRKYLAESDILINNVHGKGFILE